MASPPIVVDPRPGDIRSDLEPRPEARPVPEIEPEPAAARKPRRFRRFIGLMLLAALLWCAWAGYALYDLAAAVENEDAVALERRIDWLAVRQSLHDDLRVIPIANRPAEPALNLLGSQRGITTLIRTARFNERGWDVAAPNEPAEPPRRGFDLLRIGYAFFSGSPFAFRVDVRPDSSAVKRPLVLLFKWRGDWQLTRVFLPADAFGVQVAEPSPPRKAAPAAPAGKPQPPPAGAQRAMLYEEDASDPKGKSYTGWVTWRADETPAAPGGTPETSITAQVKLPDRPLGLTMTIRANFDRTLPASHMIEIKFDLPPDSPSGGILDLPGVQMKPNEESAGQQLAGSRVKVSKDFFMVGLSAIELDQKQNVLNLKDRPWLGIPFVYNNNSRAVLSLEKGESGEKIIAEALARWASTSAAAAEASAPKR